MSASTGQLGSIPELAEVKTSPELRLEVIRDKDEEVSKGIDSGTDTYLAAGILPFCLLGGDMLFLVGQQPRLYRPRKSSATSPPPLSSYGTSGFSPTADEAAAVDGIAREGDLHDQPPQAELVGLLWSDFGGSKEICDADAEGTASREFAEESLGLFSSGFLDADSVRLSQASMEEQLRDRSLRGSSVFECRNGGYVMFVAQVDYVPDMMLQLARKDMLDGYAPKREDGAGAYGGQGHYCEKTDFAWVPASSLLAAMNQSRNGSTRGVVVQLGECRFLRLFHKFVISLWEMGMPSVVAAAVGATPALQGRRMAQGSKEGGPPGCRDSRLPGTGAGHGAVLCRGWKAGRGHGQGQERGELLGISGGVIRGNDCVLPTFRTGNKRAKLGIIEVRPWHQGSLPASREKGKGQGAGAAGGGREGGDAEGPFFCGKVGRWASGGRDRCAIGSSRARQGPRKRKRRRQKRADARQGNVAGGGVVLVV